MKFGNSLSLKVLFESIRKRKNYKFGSSFNKKRFSFRLYQYIPNDVKWFIYRNYFREKII